VVSGEKGFSEEALLEVGWLDGCVRIFFELCPEINRSVFFGVVLHPEITSKP